MAACSCARPQDLRAASAVDGSATGCGSCVDSKLVLWVHVGNEGASPLTSGGTLNVNGVVLGQDTMLGSTDLPLRRPRQIHRRRRIGTRPDLESIMIKVDAKELECNLGNNEVVIQGPFCQ